MSIKVLLADDSDVMRPAIAVLPGLRSRQQAVASDLDGLFLVRVAQASYRWHPERPFLNLRFVALEPKISESPYFSGRLYCTERRFGTATARYPDNPAGLLVLDPQLICYSWLTGIPEVAFVVFVRKHHPEIQNFFESYDFRSTTQRIRPIGRDYGKSNRSLPL
jgi:hypothetical protein